MRWRRRGNALDRCASSSRNRWLPGYRRHDRWARLLIGKQVPADLHMKAFALKLEIRQGVVGDKADQLAQLFHVDGSFEVLRQGTIAATASIAMPLGPRFGRLFGCRLLAFLVAHVSFNS